MTLREAQEEIKRLENEETYWLNEKENLKSIVIPKAVEYKAEHVEGGVREDKMLKYVELLDERKIDETINYIYLRRKNLMNYIENELRITNQYAPLERRIYELRNDPEYIKTHNKKMPFWKIGQKVGYCTTQCYNIYKRLVKKRVNKSE